MSLWKVFFSFLYPEKELDFVLDIYIGSMSLWALGLLLLLAKDPYYCRRECCWTDISPWQLLGQDGYIMTAPGSSSLWTDGQMEFRHFCHEFSIEVHKRNKCLNVSSFIS